jgi:hypothetical protein
MRATVPELIYVGRVVHKNCLLMLWDWCPWLASVKVFDFDEIAPNYWFGGELLENILDTFKMVPLARRARLGLPFSLPKAANLRPEG